MFKVLGWIFVLAGIGMCLSILFIGPGVGTLLTGGIFLCIHKYLHRDDGRYHEATEYMPPLPPPSPRRDDSSRVANSMFGR